jgi:hypothetical protein
VWDWSDPRCAGAEHGARHVGDFYALHAGPLPEYVERVASADYYEAEGRRAYRFLAELGRATGEPDAPLFARLAAGFERYAGALAYMRRVYFHETALPWRGLAAP